jgi:hypothetical protein
VLKSVITGRTAFPTKRHVAATNDHNTAFLDVGEKRAKTAVYFENLKQSWKDVTR